MTIDWTAIQAEGAPLFEAEEAARDKRWTEAWDAYCLDDPYRPARTQKEIFVSGYEAGSAYERGQT